MEEYTQSHGNAWHAFIHGWASHTYCKLHVYLHVSVWHIAWPLLPSMASIMAPVPLHVSHHHLQQGVPTCLSTRGEQSQKTARTLHNITILHMWAHFMVWGQFIRPSLKAMRTLVIRPLQSYGNTVSLNYQKPGRGRQTVSTYPIPTEHWLERNLITKDRQKKSLHHKVTGRECRGGVRGWAGLPWVGAKVPEGYFSSQGIPPKSDSPAYSTRATKETSVTSSCKKQWGFCPPGRDSWKHRGLLKGQCTKVC